jgi:hypothetical protein
VTRRKKLPLVVFAVGLVLAAAFITLSALRSREPPQREGLESVRKGMTYAEVVAILGEPDDFHRAPRIVVDDDLPVVWSRREGRIIVYFKGEWKVSQGPVWEARSRGFLERSFDWLGF